MNILKTIFNRLFSTSAAGLYILLFAALGGKQLNKSYLIGNQEMKEEVTNFLPNPKESLADDTTGTTDHRVASNNSIPPDIQPFELLP